MERQTEPHVLLKQNLLAPLWRSVKACSFPAPVSQVMKRALPAIIFASVASIGLLMAGASWFAVEQANRMRFEAVADETLRRVEDRIEKHILLIRATLGYFATSGEVASRDELTRFVAQLRLSEDFTGAQGIGFARVTGADSEAATAVASEILVNYGRSIKPWPETDQEIRTPVVMIEPGSSSNMMALGYDMYSNPIRRDAMALARLTGVIQASGPVRLVNETEPDGQSGFLIYAPFYGAGSARPGQNPVGYVFSPFRAGDLFNAAIDSYPALPVHVTAYDQQVSDESVLYQSGNGTSAATRHYGTVSAVPVAGRNWVIDIRPSSAYEPPIDQSRTFILGIVSILLAAVLALSSRAQQHSVKVGEDLQRQAEKNLDERELLLQEMKHRIKNMIARVLAMSRQTARSSDTIDQFNASFSARLEAMAMSQDLLARSKWQSADLKTLLVQELRQVLGETLDESFIAGPSIQLNETATQAFGLTFHELATNAMKYGFACAADGGLEVTWHVRDASEGKELALIWHEKFGETVGNTADEHGTRHHPGCGDSADTGKSGAGTASGETVLDIASRAHESKPQKGGFGTRLINAAMRMELGGSIDRQIQFDSLKVTIVVPVVKIRPLIRDKARRRAQTS